VAPLVSEQIKHRRQDLEIVAAGAFAAMMGLFVVLPTVLKRGKE
jgi:hypothetical protein